MLFSTFLSLLLSVTSARSHNLATTAGLKYFETATDNCELPETALVSALSSILQVCDNGFRVGNSGKKAMEAIDMVKSLKYSGTNIDEVGLQAYSLVGSTPELGMEAAYTEQDVRLRMASTQLLDDQRNTVSASSRTTENSTDSTDSAAKSGDAIRPARSSSTSQSAPNLIQANSTVQAPMPSGTLIVQAGVSGMLHYTPSMVWAGWFLGTFFTIIVAELS